MARRVGSASPLGTRLRRVKPVVRSTMVTTRARPVPTMVSPPPVADPSALGDDRGALLDAASAEALALTRGAIAAATALAAAKVFPQGAAPATVFGNA